MKAALGLPFSTSLETNRLVTAVAAREAYVQLSRHETKLIEIYEGTDP